MKVFKGLSLTDQKIMFENLFIWDDENGDIPNRKDFKKWVLAFFESPVHINNYISDLEFDIELSEGDAFLSSTNESYRRQINFLNKLKQNTMKNLTNEARKELISKVIDTIQENDLEGLYIEELHQRAFNQEYFIIGYYEAEKWLDANYGIFAAIETIQEYEQSNFGEVNTNLGNSENVCNMLTYILGEEIIQDLNIQGEKFTKKELKRIEKELNAML